MWVAIFHSTLLDSRSFWLTSGGEHRPALDIRRNRRCNCAARSRSENCDRRKYACQNQPVLRDPATRTRVAAVWRIQFCAACVGAEMRPLKAMPAVTDVHGYGREPSHSRDSLTSTYTSRTRRITVHS